MESKPTTHVGLLSDRLVQSGTRDKGQSDRAERPGQRVARHGTPVPGTVFLYPLPDRQRCNHTPPWAQIGEKAPVGTYVRICIHPKSPPSRMCTLYVGSRPVRRWLWKEWRQWKERRTGGGVVVVVDVLGDSWFRGS